MHLDPAGLIPESISGFRKNRVTIDMILQQKTFKRIVKNKICSSTCPLSTSQAFNTVSRDGLWKIMAKFVCPPRFISMMRQFRDGTQARIQTVGEYSEQSPMTDLVE